MGERSQLRWDLQEGGPRLQNGGGCGSPGLGSPEVQGGYREAPIIPTCEEGWGPKKGQENLRPFNVMTWDAVTRGEGTVLLEPVEGPTSLTQHGSGSKGCIALMWHPPEGGGQENLASQLPRAGALCRGVPPHDRE